MFTYYMKITIKLYNLMHIIFNNSYQFKFIFNCINKNSIISIKNIKCKMVNFNFKILNFYLLVH
jgi:hypothetical protein